MPSDRRPPLFPVLAAVALAGTVLVACTAQDPPAPAPGKPPAGEGAGGGAPPSPATPAPPTPPADATAPVPAPADRIAALLADPNLALKGKLGRSLAQTRCTMCHKVDGKGGVLSGPLEQMTAERFAKMAAYPTHIAELKAKDPARYNASKKVFDEIEGDTDPKRRALRWFDAYLAKPTFDNAQAKMLKQVLTAEQIDQTLAYLLTLAPKPADGAAPAGEGKPAGR